jgi:hypothetical protein
MDTKMIGRTEFLEARTRVERGHATLPDGSLHLCRGLTAREWGEIQDQTHRIEAGQLQIKSEFRMALVVAAGALQPDGQRAYGASDIGALNEMPVSWLHPVHDRIMELSGITARQTEDAAKNLPETTAGGSSGD